MTPAESLPPLDAGAVKRYVLDTWGNCMIEHGEGPYVLHADHVAAIEKLAEGLGVATAQTAMLASLNQALIAERDAMEKLAEELAEARSSYARLEGMWNTACDQMTLRTEERDKALADLVAVRAERDQAREACEVWKRALVSGENKHDAELARLRMEQDGMCSAEELRQVRAELERVRRAASDVRKWAMPNLKNLPHHAEKLIIELDAALAATPPTRSEP